MQNISFKTRSDPNGQFVATCPELSVSCQGETEEEAINKLQSLIYFHVSSCEGIGELDAERRQIIRRDDNSAKTKVLYLPEKVRIH